MQDDGTKNNYCAILKCFLYVWIIEFFFKFPQALTMYVMNTDIKGTSSTPERLNLASIIPESHRKMPDLER